MATISENLQTLNEAKAAIKVAIENKGQDLTNVPFTQYAEKIDNIQTSNEAIIEPITITENGTYTAEDCDGYSPVTVDVKNYYVGVKAVVDSSENATNFFYNSKIEDFSHYIRYDTFEKAKNMMRATFFQSSVKRIPDMNLNKVTDMMNWCNGAQLLEEVGVLDTPNVSGAVQAFQNCPSLETFNGMDFRSMTSASTFLNGAKALKKCHIKNIKTNLMVGGSSWGQNLDPESLVYLIRELRDMGSLLTLTIGTANMTKLANTYVRTIDITDEMRAEDDLIDEKLPFELCESTDEDAMLITDYVGLKHWSIA